MKALVSQATDGVTPGQVTEEELSRIRSLLESEDWRIASSQHEVAQSSKTIAETSVVNQQSIFAPEEHPHINSQLEADVDLQLEAVLEACPEGDSREGESLDVIRVDDSGLEESGNGNLDLKVEMEVETLPTPDVSIILERADELEDGVPQVPLPVLTNEAASVDPVQLQTREAVPVDIEEEEPEETAEAAVTAPLKPDVLPELEASMAELTTPLRSWSFKKTDKKGLEFSEFSPVRVVRSKPKGMQRKQSTSQTSSLANSPDTNTLAVKPGSFPSAQETMSQEIISAPDTTTTQPSFQEVAPAEILQEVLPTVSSQAEAVESKGASQVELSGSQEVISSSQEVMSSSQEVMSSSQEVAGATSLEETTSSGISSLMRSASESPPPSTLSRTQFKKPSTITVPLHTEEKDQPQKRQETSAEEVPLGKFIDTGIEARPNDEGILLAESQLEPGFDALGVQFSTLKQGGTTLLSKVKNLAEKGKDRFTSSELGSRMEAKLEKPVTKMREILSTLAAPPTTHLEPTRSEPDDHVTGNGTTAAITTLEGNFPTESPVDGMEGVEETDSSGGKKADLEQLKEVTSIVRYEHRHSWTIYDTSERCCMSA